MNQKKEKVDSKDSVKHIVNIKLSKRNMNLCAATPCMRGVDSPSKRIMEPTKVIHYHVLRQNPAGIVSKSKAIEKYENSSQGQRSKVKCYHNVNVITAGIRRSNDRGRTTRP